MTGYDLLELAVRNLRQSKLRNGLTTIGISVGVASLVACCHWVSVCNRWRRGGWLGRASSTLYL